MPYVFIAVGLLLIVTGIRDTYRQLGTLLAHDFTGQGNFINWVAAILFVGALGYVDALRTFSRAFLALIIIGMIIRNGGFFDKLNDAIQNGPAALPAGYGGASASAATTQTASNDNSAGPDIAAYAKTAATVAQTAAMLA